MLKLLISMLSIQLSIQRNYQNVRNMNNKMVSKMDNMMVSNMNNNVVNNTMESNMNNKMVSKMDNMMVSNTGNHTMDTNGESRTVSNINNNIDNTKFLDAKAFTQVVKPEVINDRKQEPKLDVYPKTNEVENISKHHESHQKRIEILYKKPRHHHRRHKKSREHKIFDRNLREDSFFEEYKHNEVNPNTFNHSYRNNYTFVPETELSTINEDRRRNYKLRKMLQNELYEVPYDILNVIEKRIEDNYHEDNKSVIIITKHVYPEDNKRITEYKIKKEKPSLQKEPSNSHLSPLAIIFLIVGFMAMGIIYTMLAKRVLSKHNDPKYSVMKLNN
ncbi:hypothetical protein NGRA_0866 [Nosema granulosis]|uniref:Pv-fam-d protein n=1 Tax=Nosema granulosis TaxID=83296 RepID=A0A9P6H016_9MICR|nr:hypothetical protein NGRA_0866 [Nosema granulosis]